MPLSRRTTLPVDGVEQDHLVPLAGHEEVPGRVQHQRGVAVPAEHRAGCAQGRTGARGPGSGS